MKNRYEHDFPRLNRRLVIRRREQSPFSDPEATDALHQLRTAVEDALYLRWLVDHLNRAIIWIGARIGRDWSSEES